MHADPALRELLGMLVHMLSFHQGAIIKIKITAETWD